MSETTYIRIVEVGLSDSGKTKVWTVQTKDGAHTLGRIAWFGRWRKYAFDPMGGTVFEETCLREIAQFIINATLVHKEAAKKAKVANAQ